MKVVRTSIQKGNAVAFTIEGDADDGLADELIRQTWEALGHPGKRYQVSVERTEGGWLVTAVRLSAAQFDMKAHADVIADRLERLDSRGRLA